MNWTGGGLSRSRFAKGSLSAKQKNYFAKARGKIQNGRLPPPELQFFEFGGWMPERKAVDFSQHSPRIHASSPLQKTLDEFETTKPLAKRLESLRPRHEPQKRKGTRLQEARHHSRPKTPELQSAEPIVISSSPSASSVSSQEPPPPSIRGPASRSSEDIVNLPSIELKRRRLLEMDDWVGLDRPAMKPVKMKFADPTDTDLIGKRRSINSTDYRYPSYRRRPVARAAVPVKGPYEIPNTRDQYDPEADISVRIGSAVDRNDGRGSAKDNSSLSLLSDELLDGEVSQLAHELPPSAPVFNTPGPAPIRFSDHSDREVLIPSAFIDNSSSIAEASDRAHRLERHRQASSPVQGAERFTNNGIDELYEWALPFEESKGPQEKPGIRIVFGNTPRPHEQRGNLLGSSPVVRDFAFAQARTPPSPLEFRAASPTYTWNGFEISNFENRRLAERDDATRNTDSKAEGLANVVPQLISAASEGFESVGVYNDQRHSDPKVENPTVTTPPSTLAPAQILSEFQDRVASNGRLEDGITRTLQDMEQRFARETGKAQAPTLRHEDPQAIGPAGKLHPDQPQDVSEKKASCGDPTQSDPAEVENLSLRAPPEAATTAKAQQRPTKPLPSTNGDIQLPLPAWKNEEALKAAEDEEAAWRKIVFGDDQDSNEYTFEEPEVPPQTPSSPNHPLLNQPSLLAEAATSPLKQNPHLADSTFDASTSTVASRSPTYQAYAEDFLAKDSSSSSPPLPPPNSTDPHPPAQPRLPRTLVRNSISSSLLGEASSASQQSHSLGNLSSDELQWPPERLPGFQGQHRGRSKDRAQIGLSQNNEHQPSGTQTRGYGENQPKEKVVFKKSTRYVGSHTSDPIEPVVLGERVLRSGRRVSDTGGKKGKGTKGRGKAKGKVKNRGKGGRIEQEQEKEQDAVDDADDIVDD